MLKALVILSSVYYCLGNPSIEEDYYSYSYYPSYYYYNYYTELPNFDEWWWYCDGEFCTDSYIWASWLLKNDISIFYFISKYFNFSNKYSTVEVTYEYGRRPFEFKDETSETIKLFLKCKKE